MKSIDNLENIINEIVLLRLDLNVPILNGSITDTTRINKILPTINFLLKKNAKIIILSHVGRPKGKFVKELSMEPIARELEKKINQKIKLVKQNIYELNKSNIFKDPNDKIIILENIRFYLEEEKNNMNFAKHLASLGNIYVNDAFSCSHREHASICNITKFLPSYIGIQMQNEIYALKKITSEIKKPITCIIGGSKISTKINIIKNLIKKFDNIIIVGAMANNIFKQQGLQIGNSINEENSEQIVSEIFNQAKKYKCNIIYPKDIRVGKSFKDNSKEKTFDQVLTDDLILDIGQNTLREIKEVLDNSATILWNGPAGYFENREFSNGSKEIAKHIANKHGNIYSVAGGGDTVAVINSLKLIDKFDFVSTAGGAFLEYLEGKNLPGIRALN